MAVADELSCTTRVSLPQGYHYHRGIITTGVSFSHKEQAPKCSCYKQSISVDSNE